MKKNLFRKIALFAAVFLLGAAGANAQIATGGSYTLQQSVIAGGGGTGSDSVNNNYKVEGTAAQSAAGAFGSGGSYTVRGGFWAANPLAPTAAGAVIGGRVVGLFGEGVRNVNVTLTGGTLVVPRTARTNSFGNFTFEDVEVGHVYVLSVEHKKYGFAQNSYVFSLFDNVTDLIFKAAWEN